MPQGYRGGCAGPESVGIQGSLAEGVAAEPRLEGCRGGGQADKTMF